MRRTTGLVIRHRRLVLVTWIALLVLGALATSSLSSLLSNQFSVPGSESQRGLDILRTRFHERSAGAFTLVAKSTGPALSLAAVQAAARRGAGAIPDGKAGPVLAAGPGAAYAEIDTSLENARASDRTPALREATTTTDQRAAARAPRRAGTPRGERHRVLDAPCPHDRAPADPGAGRIRCRDARARDPRAPPPRDGGRQPRDFRRDAGDRRPVRARAHARPGSPRAESDRRRHRPPAQSWCAQGGVQEPCCR
jgi:hypothetical protein